MCNLIVRLTMILATLFWGYPFPAISAESTQIIRDDRVEIEIFIYGEGSEALIMAAGNGRPAAQLEDLARNIAASGMQVVTFNYRTIGASKGPVDEITLHEFARDVWRIADGLALEKVHLAGKTYGNRVMRTAAADRPERTQSVILIGAGGDILPPADVQALYWRYVDPETPREEWQKLQAELMFAPGNEHLASRSATLGSYPELATVQIKASNATPKSEWRSGGTAPMLILACLKDRIAVPENALSLAKSRPNTWMIGIPGCGHNMIYERQEDLARLIVDYIAQHPTAGR